MLGRIDEISKKKLGQFFKQRRKESRLSQEDIAKSLGSVSSQFISNVERGQSLYTIKQIVKITDVLRLSPIEVIGLINQELKDSLDRSWRNEIETEVMNNETDFIGESRR